MISATRIRIAILICIAVILAVAVYFIVTSRYMSSAPLKLGVLFAQTGARSKREAPLIAAVLLAVDEMNSRGGLLGRKILPITFDTATDDTHAAEMARRFIIEEKVSAIIGCMTSSCRKSVLPVIEELGGALFYPTFYEGLESSPNAIYTGGAPNQQLLPGVQWAHRFLGNRMFIVGSDYVWPRASAEIIKDRLHEFGVEVIGEEYFQFGHSDFKAVASRIKQTTPSVVINLLVGQSNQWFLNHLFNAGIGSDNINVMSFALVEHQIATMDQRWIEGSYVVFNYFTTIESAHNAQFLKAFKERTGGSITPSDPVASTYGATLLWGLGVRNSGSENAPELLAALRNVTVALPEGTVRVDPVNNHLWKRARIGKVRGNAVEIIWESPLPIPPEPFPRTRTQEAWKELLRKLYEGWGGAWAPRPK